jgi:hypothetical protein
MMFRVSLVTVSERKNGGGSAGRDILLTCRSPNSADTKGHNGAPDCCKCFDPLLCFFDAVGRENAHCPARHDLDAARNPLRDVCKREFANGQEAVRMAAFLSRAPEAECPLPARTALGRSSTLCQLAHADHIADSEISRGMSRRNRSRALSLPARVPVRASFPAVGDVCNYGISRVLWHNSAIVARINNWAYSGRVEEGL